MLGLQKGAVALLPHSELWHALFADEKERLDAAIGDEVVAIEHIGSTAVCGLAAKPILDIAAAIHDAASGLRCVRKLEEIGYHYRGENGIAGRFYFVKGEPRTHHLHVLPLDSDLWRNHLAFRDALRTNEQWRAAYERLKRELALQHATDRVAYTDAKGQFIEEVLRRAKT
ncbi:MAG: GrpB family protein [Acidobacteriota bacterium]|nr:GrpB family protein [Acidobacteriota bacterium]